ncbi:hypothetical protein QKC54_gp0513 [Megavirus baoshan]|uniref:Uncharacterized protein n=1 Tax=Megavirus baoshan TaxID=2496520 RepID=A0A3S8UWV9_9VIRU|nr:hypothetical protein QKC54_gp0513 [Megavirus baoshan]AZL89316.1 hypothetical protein Mb0559 [Megavirus baoshan]
MIHNDNNKLTLKSINGRKCLTKCYPSGNTYFHPILLTGVTEMSKNSCAIEPTHSKNPLYLRENDIIYADTCNIEDNETHILPDELESVLLSFYFNPGDFLSSIYDLHTFDDVIYWTLENDYLPFNTIKRIHNCAWKVFGSNIENLSSTVLEYYYDISKTYWLKDYSKILQNDISINLVADSNKDYSNSNNEFNNIIESNIYTYDFFIDIVKKYINQNFKQWNIIKSHYDNLKNFIFTEIKQYLNDQNI